MRIQNGFALELTPEGGAMVTFPAGHALAGARLELNETALCLWCELSLGTDAYGLQALLRNRFSLSQAAAASTVDHFLSYLREADCLVE